MSDFVLDDEATAVSQPDSAPSFAVGGGGAALGAIHEVCDPRIRDLQTYIFCSRPNPFTAHNIFGAYT